MVDARYEITQQEEQKILSTVFASMQPLRLKTFPPKEKKKVVILRTIAKEFEEGIRYSEVQVNEILKDIYPDYVTLRRYLIEYGCLLEEIGDLSFFPTNGRRDRATFGEKMKRQASMAEKTSKNERF